MPAAMSSRWFSKSDTVQMPVSPGAVFFVKITGMIGFIMTVYPPLRAGFRHLELLKLDEKPIPKTDLGKILKQRVTDFLKKSADEFRLGDFKLMAWGLLVTFLAGLHGVWVAYMDL